MDTIDTILRLLFLTSIFSGVCYLIVHIHNRKIKREFREFNKQCNIEWREIYIDAIRELRKMRDKSVLARGLEARKENKDVNKIKGYDELIARIEKAMEMLRKMLRANLSVDDVPVKVEIPFLKEMEEKGDECENQEKS